MSKKSILNNGDDDQPTKNGGGSISSDLLCKLIKRWYKSAEKWESLGDGRLDAERSATADTFRTCAKELMDEVKHTDQTPPSKPTTAPVVIGCSDLLA